MNIRTELARLADDLTGGAAAALTGAGVSVPSGIPDFRSPGGIWERYDPFEHGHIAALRDDPAKVWDMLWELDAIVRAARPNPAHTAMAELERRGVLRTTITQNPDALHQRAGSTNVVELHGTGATVSCMACGRGHDRDAALAAAGRVPRCDACGGVLRPDVVLFGEPLPEQAAADAWAAVRDCAVLLVVGTSAEVEPAASLPLAARSAGAAVWEVNPQASLRTSVDGRLTLPAEEAMPALVREVAARA